MIGKRVFNFSAGPAVLPLPVLEQVRDELLCYQDAGASILELSHRGKHFVHVLEETRTNLRQLLGIPASHEIFFMQGGSRLQFSTIPMNLLRGSSRPADYILTGSWGKMAMDEALREGPVNVAWDGSATNYDRLPSPGSLRLTTGAPYVYFTSNETIQGVQFSSEPEVGNGTLICDASSDFLCRPLDVTKYGLLYACAQKNAGPAGVTALIMDRELLARCGSDLPGYCQLRAHADNDSCWNTPPTFAIYVMGLVIQWLQKTVGGLAAMEKLNTAKAKLIYDVIDGSDGFYQGHALPDCRSIMNVTFRLPNEQLEKAFLAKAEANELTNLKGHRSVGGIRASIYNAMPLEGAKMLADVMSDFCRAHR